MADGVDLWGIYASPRKYIVHVMPEDDLKEHDASIDCWCGPRRAKEGWSFVVSHNALDGRE